MDAGGIAAEPDSLCPSTGSHHTWLCRCQLHESMCPLAFIVLAVAGARLVRKDMAAVVTPTTAFVI